MKLARVARHGGCVTRRAADLVFCCSQGLAPLSAELAHKKLARPRDEYPILRCRISGPSCVAPSFRCYREVDLRHMGSDKHPLTRHSPHASGNDYLCTAANGVHRKSTNQFAV